MRPAVDPGEAPDRRELCVRLFGGLGLWRGDERLPPLESPRARSLLGYVLLHGDASHARQRLAFMLWPDSSEAQARTNLRNVLHTMRRAVPAIEGILEVTPRTLQRRRDLSCWVDVSAFESALTAAEAAEPGSEVRLAALRTAVGLYAGDLLEGSYDDWVIEQRERYRDRYLSGLGHLAAALADRGEHAEAIRHGRELVRCEPLDEHAYRLLMRVHAAAGDRAASIRAYHECVASLQRELGVEPSPETRETHAALTARDRPDDGGDDASDTTRVSAVALVGRDPEWERLTGCWRSAESGRAQMVVVTGEPGVGKTRLVEELAAWCAQRGAAVASGRAYPTEGELGYGLVMSWLRSPVVAGRLRRSSASDAAEVARLLPELATEPAPVGVVTDEAERRRRLFDALARTLTTPDRPTLLFADDAQWCDEASLQLMHYLVRLGPGTPLLVAVTARREELDDRHPLTALVGGLQVLDRVTDIPLERLNRAGTEALARQLADTDLDAATVDALHTDTEGNPLFIVETVRAGPARGPQMPPALSPKLQAVIGSRLRQLPDEARELVGVAATIGREFTAELLRAVVNLDELDLARGLDELWLRGIIREQGTDAYDFSHGKIRDAAYEALRPATRRRNHLLVAAALLEIHRANPEPVSGQVAANYDRAGDVDEAIGWYRRAAAQAQRLYADTEAVRLLERARQLVPGSAGDPARLELELLTALSTPLSVVEGWASDRLEDTQRRAIAVAGRVGTDPAPPLVRSIVMSTLCRDDFDGALAAAAQLHTAARRAGDAGLLSESEYLLGIASFWGGRLTAARRHFEQVVDRFDPDQRAEHLVRFGQDPKLVCLSRLANTLFFLGDRDGARRTRDAAIAMAAEPGHPFSAGVARIFAGLVSLDLEEYDAFAGFAAALGADHDRAGRANDIKSMAMDGLAQVLDGRVGAGLDGIRAAIAICGPVNPAPGFRAALMRLLAAGCDLAGEAGAGLRATTDALELTGTRLWEPELRRLRAEFLAATGAPRGDVEAELHQAAGVARLLGAVGHLDRIERSRRRLAADG